MVCMGMQWFCFKSQLFLYFMGKIYILTLLLCCINSILYCAVPENIHTHPTEGIGISWGVRDSMIPKNLKTCIKLNWNFQRCGEVLEKIPSICGGGMDIFWNYTLLAHGYSGRSNMILVSYCCVGFHCLKRTTRPSTDFRSACCSKRINPLKITLPTQFKEEMF